MKSIRVRLLVFVLVAFAAVWTTVSVIAYARALHEVEELLDAEMVQMAQVLLTTTLHEIEEGDGKSVKLADQKGGHRYIAKIAFQVWEGEALLFHSDNAPLTRLTTTVGYSDQWVEGKYWRLFVLKGSNGGYSVQVGQLHEVRNQLLHEIVLIMSLPVILALPLLALLFWWGISHSLQPLQRVANEVRQRSAHDMSPLPDSATPVEIKPLTDAINELLQQLRNTFERERRFTADAAHELRTPLASIKTQGQVAQRAVIDEERQQALRQINAGVDRATHLVEQLLTLARLDPASAVDGFMPFNLCRLLSDVIADIASLAHAKKIDIGMLECQDSMLFGSEGAVAILIRNLLDNAICYTATGGVVDAAVVSDGERLTLTVSDNGPGIVAEQRTRVLERFYRANVEGAAPGCGLGLSIVKRIAELHDATLTLDQPESGRGLRVAVVFPNRTTR